MYITHLPFYDYILYGVGLFLKEKITPTALEKLFSIILDKKTKLMPKIVKIGEEQGVTIRVHSPFENLFTDFQPDGPLTLSEHIFDQLNVPNIENEEELVQYCLKNYKEII